MVSKEEFKDEVWEIAAEIHAVPRQIRVMNMKRKIGSCSSKKIITFDISILNFEGSLRREVIVHELLHLRYQNHGKLFQAVLKSYLSRVR
ncbi:MAG: M48 family metallopeptidase [Thermoplasmatales archaeon]